MCGRIAFFLQTNYLRLQVVIARHVFKKHRLVGIVVDTATEKLPAVAHRQILDPQNGVVAIDLVEHLLRDFHRRRFVFHNHKRASPPVKHHRIASALTPVLIDCNLIAHKTCRITLAVNQMAHKHLPHILFRSHSHILATEAIEYLLPPVDNASLNVVVFKILLWHICCSFVKFV